MSNVPTWLLALVASLVTGSLSVAATFNFDNAPVLSTPFSLTNNGITATFTSIPSEDILPFGLIGPGLITSEGYDPNGTGQFLGLGFRNAVDITFSQKVNSVILDYQVFDFGGIGFFSLDAIENGILVGSVFSLAGTTENLYGKAGEIRFSESNFDELLLADVNHDFGIDNIEISQTPEPATLGLLILTGSALICICKLRLRPLFGASIPR